MRFARFMLFALFAVMVSTVAGTAHAHEQSPAPQQQVQQKASQNNEVTVQVEQGHAGCPGHQNSGGKSCCSSVACCTSITELQTPAFCSDRLSYNVVIHTVAEVTAPVISPQGPDFKPPKLTV